MIVSSICMTDSVYPKSYRIDGIEMSMTKHIYNNMD